MPAAHGDDTAMRFLYPDAGDLLTPVGRAVNEDFLADEEAVVRRLANAARLEPSMQEAVQATAVSLVQAVRDAPGGKSGLDAFLREYDLSSQEGVLLMCLAEALLRIPDDADRGPPDRRQAARRATGRVISASGHSLFVNASTWGLMLTGRIVQLDPHDLATPAGALGRMAGRIGEPLVRSAMRQAMRIMGHQFVMGRSIEEALAKSLSGAHRRYRYTFDMLGEAALTAADAERYFEAYCNATVALAARAGDYADAEARPSVSVKLSAMHPRFERSHRRQVLGELGPRLVELCVLAREAGIALTLDTEESERLELTLELLEAVCRDPRLAGWSGFGIAIQTYQKRAPAVLRWIIRLARETRRRLHLRLVKGAYWDSEIKRAQERGLPGYPVFTRKPNTDVAYLACARLMLEEGPELYPQFATHNAHTVAAVWHLAKRAGREFEYQRLHGMGEELYGEAAQRAGIDVPCRVYAPVGQHEDLLPYLVRRLLENGSNTSFVNRIVNAGEAVEAIVADPVHTVDSWPTVVHPRIRLPQDLYQPERRNSSGLHLADGAVLRDVRGRGWSRTPVAAGARRRSLPVASDRDPRQRSVTRRTPRRCSARWCPRHASRCTRQSKSAARAQPDWDATPAPARAATLDKAAELFEQSTPELVAMCVREAGKTVPDAIAELREAVDFLRYYAARARADFASVRPPAGSDRREQRALAARPRSVRLYQPVEFPAGDLHRPGGCGARGRQCSGRQAGRADSAGRRAGRATAAAGWRTARCAALPAGRRCGRWRRGRRQSARRWRGLHRLDRDRAADPSRTVRTRRPDPGADRRDRRPERDDRRQLGAAGAGGARRSAVGVQQRRSALLGVARALRAGGHCTQGAATGSPATWASWSWVIRPSCRPTSGQ